MTGCNAPRMLALAAFTLAGGFASAAWSAPIGGQPAPEEPPLVAPATQPTTGPAAPRRLSDVLADFDVQARQLSAVLPGVDVLFDDAKRAEIAPRALPFARRMGALLDEAYLMAPRLRRIARARLELAGMMSLLGDPDSVTLLGKLAVSNDKEEAVGATSWEYVVAFAHAGKDAEAQSKVVADLTSLARGSPDNDMIAEAVYMMIQRAATPEVSAQAEKIVTDILQGPMAQRMAADLIGARKLHDLENRPLVVQGDKVDGSKFSTADWKGKVVLVQFWATWRPQSMHQFPRIKKMYDQYHAQGLEIIGISCDTDADDLKAFLAANPGASWPQLFDPRAAAAHRPHPLAELYSVNTLPMLFLIDRNGIVRTVTAEQNMETLIPKLLAEKAE